MGSPGRSRHLRGTFRLILLSLAAAAVLASGAVAAKHHAKAVGRVYTETNAASNNQVLVFDRFANGTLKQRTGVSTGGSGGLQPQPGCTPPGGCPILDTQGELALSADGHLLF